MALDLYTISSFETDYPNGVDDSKASNAFSRACTGVFNRRGLISDRWIEGLDQKLAAVESPPVGLLQNTARSLMELKPVGYVQEFKSMVELAIAETERKKKRKAVNSGYQIGLIQQHHSLTAAAINIRHVVSSLVERAGGNESPNPNLPTYYAIWVAYYNQRLGSLYTE